MSRKLSAPAGDFETVQRLCRDYRRQLKKGVSARIEDVLDDVPPDAREMLFQNLLHIDIEYQRSRQKTPSSHDYIARFPDLAGVIRDAFFESTLMSQNSLLETPAFKRTQLFEVPAARKLGEYEILRELGRGSFGVVYEARHLHRHDVVALKTLPRSLADGDVPEQDGESLHRFKREFRSLADISHVNLVGLHSLECDGTQWFFTMDLVRGTDFISFVRPNGELDVDRLRSAFGQLVAGTLALHANFVIHRDLKPSNVMIDEHGHVVLLDFGLALEQQRSTMKDTATGIAGTPAYMAPEQARGDTATAACDWYAVGVMLYEALAGQLPFSGPTLQLLQDKQQRKAPPLPVTDRLPEDLCEICSALLSTSPNDRPDPAEIVRSVSPATDVSPSAPGARTQPLVGRDQQLQELQSALQNFLSTGLPVAMFVEGRSGEGKTALCSAFLDDVREQSVCTVLAGRCYDRESMPFKALDSAIDAICTYLNGITPEHLSSVLPRDMQVLQHTFPVFGRVKPIRETRSSDPAAIDEQEIRNRAFLSLRELLGRIADRKPVILFVDDLQWGDTDSAEVLLQMLRGPDAPRVFFLGTYRTDEANDSRFLAAWQRTAEQRQIDIDSRTLAVSPLTAKQCRQLMVEMLQTNTEIVRRRADQFTEQTAGNAFLLTELINGFDPHTDSTQQRPVQQMIQDKLQELPDESTLLLHIICVSGQALRAQEVAAVAGDDAVPMATLTRLRAARLIRFVGDDATCVVDTYHDRIRETVLAQLSPTEHQSLHGRLGSVIEQIDGGLSEDQLHAIYEGSAETAEDWLTLRLFDLSFHFAEAQDSVRAFAYSVLAARQARRQFSLEVAAARYEMALKFAQAAGPAARYRLLLQYGEALRLLCQCDDAERILAEAAGLATTDLERCAAELERANAIREAGRYQDSAEEFTTTLRSMGVRVPASLASCVVGIAAQGCIQLLHTLLRYPRPGSSPMSRQQSLTLQLLNGYTMSVWFRSTPMVVWTTLKVLNQSERAAISRELCISWSLHGMICTLLGLDRRGERYKRRSEGSTADDDFTTRTKASLYAVVGHYSRGRFTEARQLCLAGLKVVPQSGEAWLGLLLNLHRLLAEYRLGQLSVALSGALEGFQQSVRMGDANTAHDYVNFVAMITDGHFQFEQMQAALTPIPDNIQATNQILQAEARWHLGNDRPQEAFLKAEEGFQLMKSHVVINHITNPNFPLLLEATRKYAAELRSLDATAAEALLKQGYRRAKWAERITGGTGDEPAVLRELGHLHSLRGRVRKAIRSFQRSCRAARQSGMELEFALSKLALEQQRAAAGLGSEEACAAAHAHLATFADQITGMCGHHPLLRLMAAANDPGPSVRR
ncbi:MAG: hypothetical protein Fues2KO_27630 [Fuerstiella sp.]